jgi:hypothetical protein
MQNCITQYAVLEMFGRTGRKTVASGRREELNTEGAEEEHRAHGEYGAVRRGCGLGGVYNL